jgi:hypothetical protein
MGWRAWVEVKWVGWVGGRRGRAGFGGLRHLPCDHQLRKVNIPRYNHRRPTRAGWWDGKGGGQARAGRNAGGGSVVCWLTPCGHQLRKVNVPRYNHRRPNPHAGGMEEGREGDGAAGGGSVIRWRGIGVGKEQECGGTDLAAISSAK